MKRFHVLFFLIISAVLAQGQTTITMPSTGSQTVVLQPGTTYTVLDPGGTGSYPNGCNGYLLLQSSTGSAINIAGSLNTESSYDYLLIYDNSEASGDNSYYSGTGYTVNVTCSSGYSMLYFHSDNSVTRDGFSLTVSLACTCPAEIQDVSLDATDSSSATISWVDTSAASLWTVEYGLHPDSLLQSVTSTNPQATLTGLLLSHQYYYRILNNSLTVDSLCDCIPIHQFRMPCGDILVQTHDISTGPLVIPSISCVSYVITGTTTSTDNYIEIANGY